MSRNNYANPFYENHNYRYHRAGAVDNNPKINEQYTHPYAPIIYHHYDYHSSNGAPQMVAFTDYISHLSGYPTMYTGYNSSSYDYWNGI